MFDSVTRGRAVEPIAVNPGARSTHEPLSPNIRTETESEEEEEEIEGLPRFPNEPTNSYRACRNVYIRQQKTREKYEGVQNKENAPPRKGKSPTTRLREANLLEPQLGRTSVSNEQSSQDDVSEEIDEEDPRNYRHNEGNPSSYLPRRNNLGSSRR